VGTLISTYFVDKQIVRNPIEKRAHMGNALSPSQLLPEAHKNLLRELTSPLSFTELKEQVPKDSVTMSRKSGFKDGIGVFCTHRHSMRKNLTEHKCEVFAFAVSLKVHGILRCVNN
jgi:hypothetical protein